MNRKDMKTEEFIETVTNLGREPVVLYDRGVCLEFRRITKELSMMNMRTRDGEELMTVPYDKAEKCRYGIELLYNGCLRAMMKVDGVVRMWGV